MKSYTSYTSYTPDQNLQLTVGFTNGQGAALAISLVYNVHMERYVPFEVGEFFHVYNRGVDKRNIFFSKGDWDHFLWLLWARNSKKHIRNPRTSNGQGASLAIGKGDQNESLVDIIAYSLMENHFHLLLHEKIEGGITQFMRRLLTAYSMYMNKKYDRTGPLMCRPFRAKHVDSDEYFRWLVSYIHLNPVELVEKDWKEKGIKDLKKVKKYLDEYKYSSYSDYFADVRNESLILNQEALPIDIRDLEDIVRMTESVKQLP